jgi:hypothetical protein
MKANPKRPRIKAQSVTALKAKLDKVFSKYIRIRNTDENGYGECVTCAKCIHWKDGDAGHFITRAALSTRFEPRNVHLQCKGCNSFGNGMQYLHGKKIDEMYGSGTAETLYMISRQSVKIPPAEYQILIDSYTRIFNEIESGKMG